MTWLLPWQLLGKDSADIDVALDNMTGQNFCEKVNEYLELIGEEQKGIGVIQWYVILIMLILSDSLLSVLIIFYTCLVQKVIALVDISWLFVYPLAWIMTSISLLQQPWSSKHLETARMLILDIWIDFVNLRSETYAENSRIPTMVCTYIHPFAWLFQWLHLKSTYYLFAYLSYLLLRDILTCLYA